MIRHKIILLILLLVCLKNVQSIQMLPLCAICAIDDTYSCTSCGTCTSYAVLSPNSIYNLIFRLLLLPFKLLYKQCGPYKCILRSLRH